jgi:hypothetical protein
MIISNFIFLALKKWFIGITALAIKNYGAVSFISLFLTGGLTISQFMINDTVFGASNFLLLIVIGTVLINTWYGIQKSLLKSKVFFMKAQHFEFGEIKYNYFLKKSNIHKFKINKVYFVFFKVFSFLGYLFFAKLLITDTIDSSAPFVIKAMEITAEILIRVPLAIFWYYEFKSIGENSTYVYGKKAPIFTIVEGIFEPRIFKFFGSKTPTDGVHDNESDDFPKQDKNQNNK